jgi:hypothetical protein
MNEDRMRAATDDELDARLSGYFTWQSEGLRHIPTAQEVAVRIAGGSMRVRRSVNSALAWVALALALLVAGLAIVVAGNSKPALVVAPPNQSQHGSPDPTDPATFVTFVPSYGPGVCGSGRVELRPAASGEVPPEAASIVTPTGGRIAMALENRARDGGAIVIAGSEGLEPRLVATFTGEEIQAVGGVQVVAWSPDGNTLVIGAGNESPASRERSCGNLWTVATDGSRLVRLTDNGPGEAPGMSAFAPDSIGFAYLQDNLLYVLSSGVDPHSAPRRIPVGLCGGGPHTLRWSPDGTRILLVCASTVVVVDVLTGNDTRIGLPADALDAVWIGDGESIVAAAGDEVPGLVGGPLSILDLDPVAGTATVRVRSDLSTEWVLGRPLLSPDGRWLLVWGDGNVADVPFYRTYVVDTATGATRIAEFPILMDFGGTIFDAGLPGAVWLEGNDRVLTGDNQTLYEVDLVSLTRAPVGGVPAQDFAWFSFSR